MRPLLVSKLEHCCPNRSSRVWCPPAPGFGFNGNGVLVAAMALVAGLDLAFDRRLCARMGAPYERVAVNVPRSAACAPGKPGVRSAHQRGDMPMSLRRQVVFWTVTTLALVLAVWLLRGVLLPFVAGMTLAYLLDPLANRLERAGANRVLAALLIVGVFVIGFLRPDSPRCPDTCRSTGRPRSEAAVVRRSRPTVDHRPQSGTA